MQQSGRRDIAVQLSPHHQLTSTSKTPRRGTGQNAKVKKTLRYIHIRNKSSTLHRQHHGRQIFVAGLGVAFETPKRETDLYVGGEKERSANKLTCTLRPYFQATNRRKAGHPLDHGTLMPAIAELECIRIVSVNSTAQPCSFDHKHTQRWSIMTHRFSDENI